MPDFESSRCYLVRTIPKLVASSIVGVGWSDLDFSTMSDAEEAISEIDNAYGIGRRGNQVRRFFAIQEGDLIVASLPYSVSIGQATGDIFYAKAFFGEDRANQRHVLFPKDASGEVAVIPRSAFSEAFQRRLRVRGMTVNDLDEFRDEVVAAHDKVRNGEDFSWGNRIAEEVEAAEIAFKKRLLANIQYGRTNLQTGGVGLERLVKELLQLDGYQAAVLSKQAFPGFADADVKASRSDACTTVKLLVQVKHHSGFSDSHGLAQLEEITRVDLPEYYEHQLIFCTSACVSEAFLERADELNIQVIDGEALADWITHSMDGLSPQTKISLGICEVPSLVTKDME